MSPTARTPTPDPAGIHARLDALRAAGRELRTRPFDEVVASVAAVLERWRDPKGPERLRLEAELPAVSGFAPATLREGLERALAPWSADAWRALVREEIGGHWPAAHPVTAVLLAGAIPMPSLLGVLAPLALGSPVLAKTAARDPLTAWCVAESIAAVDPRLARCVSVVDVPRSAHASLAALLSADCVVATGSDETLDAVAARVGPAQVLQRHGHKVSVAVLGPGCAGGPRLGRAAQGVALDTALWDQLGCLSPVAVFAVGHSDSGRALASAIAERLDAIASRLPPGEVDAHSAGLAAHERHSAEVRAAAGQAVALHTGAGAAWTVIAEADARIRPAPPQRFLRVHPVADAAALATALVPWQPHLAGVALDGFDAGARALADTLRAAGASRVCAPGELQTPPLSWPRDGLPVLASLKASIIANT